MSRLATDICLEFFLRNKDRLRAPFTGDLNEEILQNHFYANATLIFQTYDSIFMTGYELATSMEEWLSMRQEMLITAQLLAMVGGGTQEILTNFHKGQMLPGKRNQQKYGLSSIGELVREDFIGKIQHYIRSAMGKIGGYGYCPALKDGTLVGAYFILFDIYTECLLKKKFQNSEGSLAIPS